MKAKYCKHIIHQSHFCTVATLLCIAIDLTSLVLEHSNNHYRLGLYFSKNVESCLFISLFFL